MDTNQAMRSELTVRERAQNNVGHDCRQCGLSEINPAPVVLLDAVHTIIGASLSAEEVCDIPRNDFVGSNFFRYFSPSDEAIRFLTGAFNGKPMRNVPLVVVNETGMRVSVMCSANRCSCQSGVGRVLVGFYDVTDLRRHEEQLMFQTRHDPLTSVLNRVYLRDALVDSLDDSRAAGSVVGVVHIGIDNFKGTNDVFGHFVGDDLLKQLAARIKASIGRDGFVGRWSGDEFIVVADSVRRMADINALVVRLMSVVKKPIDIDGYEMAISCCIGVSFQYRDGRRDADSMLQEAATALHQAKREGKGTAKYFSAEMRCTSRRRMEIGNELHRALRNMEFTLAFQPRLSLHSNTIFGVEALVRWNSEVLGEVSPSEFIPVAEGNGMINQLGEWVLENACRHAAAWKRDTDVNVNVSVNISARQFLSSKVTAMVSRVIAATGLPAGALELELTETMLIADSKRVLDTLKELKDLGVRLAIDDFCTGYSSLSYLKRFPLDYLKIDRSFIADIPGDGSSEAIVKAIIAMADNMNLKVVAEGVESRQQLEFLKDLGCHEIQGFFFAKPMDATQMDKFLLQQKLKMAPASGPECV